MNHDSSGSHARRAGPRRPAIVAALAAAALAAAALAAAALLAAACSGSHSSGSGAQPGPPNVQKVDAFAQCMRGHGLADFYVTSQASSSSASAGPVLKLGPGEIVQGVDTSTQQYRAANNACQHLLPLASAPMLSAAELHRLVKAAACMRAHGFPGFADPTVQNGQLARESLPASIDTASPQFQAAQRACHPAM